MDDQVLHQAETPTTPVHPTEDLGPTATHPATVDFPQLLQAMRVERGWSKADLAKRAKFDPSTITRLEQGSRDPERDTVLQLADGMALSLVDRDRLLAAAGYRSETWDDPDLVQIAMLLADHSIPPIIRHEIRTMVRMAVSHGRLARTQASRLQSD